MAGTTHVLVIDDNEIDRTLMMELLEAGGFQVSGLPSPIGATREVRRTQASVVVIDQNMPVMDGSKLTKLFRSNPVMERLRVVLVSGNDPATMRAIASEVSADSFVSKSELRVKLVDAVKGALSKAATGS